MNFRETKNYTSIAKELIQKKLAEFVLVDEDITIVIKKVLKFEGEAQINIRKGK